MGEHVHSAARQEFTFDQAFTLVKFFFERATLYTVEEVQASPTPSSRMEGD